ncbi:hypothetical protein [Novacetimonas maltaceti]|uniref:Uncharacterized protein n=2 Tax=Novacetimonas maltaceti TaxID=1203393 RepID=A0A2S3VXC8_9PROT|nr:hypothetical protein [Novacetimonas maltaceti]POF61261.1 hypothetical protein KMAL_31190 [Novacetimonas maltaceti]
MRKIFLSGVMDPVTNPDALDGIAGAVNVPRSAVGGLSTTSFPTLVSGGVLAVQNTGTSMLTLFYKAGEAAAPKPPYQAVPSGGFGPEAGTISLRPAQTAYLTDVKGGEGVTYAGGPFTIVPGTLQYVADAV